MKTKGALKLFLQLFADGGDGGAGAEMGVSQNPAGSNQGVEPAKIQYGKVAPSPAEAAEPEVQQAPNKSEEFTRLIRGEYKDEYNKRVKSTLDERFKSQQAALDRAAKQAPLVDRLASRYGLDANDVDAIIAKMDDDDALYEAEAIEKGLSVDQLKAMKKVEMENQSLHRQMEERKAQEGSQRIYSEWLQKGESLKAVYPNFDLQTELQNPDFSQLLIAGIDMQKAYEVTHLNELVPSAMQFAAKSAEEKISKSVAANMARPRENGMNAAASAMIKSDPSKLTNADLAEIERRVARGERISF